MNRNGLEMEQRETTEACFGSCAQSATALALALLVATPLSLSLGQEEGGEEIFELSPFEVTGDNDRGYEAQNTLSGTRLNTSTKEIGVTMTILTDQFMEDLAVNSTNQMIDFTPGSEKETTQNGEGAATVYWGDNTMIRGRKTRLLM